MADFDTIRGIVRQALSTRLPELSILAVNLRPHEFSDGEEFIGVSIVFDDRKSPFVSTINPEELTSEDRDKIQRLDSANGDVIEEMRRLGDQRFAGFSLIAKSDLGKKSPEAA